MVAGDRQSGALKLELQQPLPIVARVGAKALVLLAGWTIASVPTLAAIALWRSYGGSVYPPELAAVAAGHLLNAGLTIALASAAAAITDHPSTAAIVTLSVTVGTWILNFIAAVHGGVWERAAGYTPTAMVAEFQHGLVRLDVLLAAALLVGGGLVLAALWMRLGVPVARRTSESLALAAATAAADWRDREHALVTAAGLLVTATNDLGLAAPVDPAPRPFHTRDIRVVSADRLTVALTAAVTDPEVRALLDRLGRRRGGPVGALPGTIDQVTDSTEILTGPDRRRAAAPLLGLAPLI